MRCFAIILSLSFALCFSTQIPAQSSGAKRRAVVEYPDAPSEIYKTIGNTELKLFIFSPDDSRSDRPAIVFFFGGGWTSGSPKQFEPHCRYLASRGMVAITVDYRVMSRHDIKAVDCVRDAKSAIRWVRTHSKKLGIDPNRIAAGGGSAGGHLAACTATIEAYNEPEEDATISSVPNALVLFNPAAALAPFDGMPPPSESQRQKAATLEERLGVPPLSVSPAHHVSKSTPPTIMFFGTEDELLPGAHFMERAMKARGGQCEVVTYEGQKHGFFNYGRSKNETYFRDTVLRTDRFFVALGWLMGEPDPAALTR